MDRFLVTGGAGFIGSHLTDALLAAGARVRVLDDLSTGQTANLDPRCELLPGDVADPTALRAAMAGTAGCFHLAAIASVARCHADWRGTHRINQGGSIAVFEAARDAGRLPVVYASSAAVYGDLNGAVAHEEAACVPLSTYGADKLGSELHARVAWRVHGVPTLGLRFFNVYGRRQDPSSPYSGVVSIFAARLSRGERLTLHGDGTQTRDFVHVGDVAMHLIAAMRLLRQTPQVAVLNVCTGRASSVRDLAAILAGLFGTVAAIDHGPARPGDIVRSLGDPAHAIALLGVAATTRLESGLAETFAGR